MGKTRVLIENPTFYFSCPPPGTHSSRIGKQTRVTTQYSRVGSKSKSWYPISRVSAKNFTTTLAVTNYPFTLEERPLNFREEIAFL